MDQALCVLDVTRLIVCQYVAVTKPPKVFSLGVRLPLETTMDVSKKPLKRSESRTERFHIALSETAQASEDSTPLRPPTVRAACSDLVWPNSNQYQHAPNITVP